MQPPFRILLLGGSLSGVTIRGGDSVYPGCSNHDCDGGGLYASGSGVRIFQCQIEGNSARFGGGIYVDGTVTIEQTVVDGNHATAQSGGGIAVAGNVTILDSTFSNNDAHYFGGGIYMVS